MRVLIVKVSSLGDIIHTLPAVTDAHAARPDLRFDWVVEEAFTEVPAWHPAVDNVIPVAIRRWRRHIIKSILRGEIRDFRRQLQRVHYNLVVDAQGLIKSGIISRLSRGLTIGLSSRTVREPLATLFYNKVYTVPWNEHAVERVRLLFSRALNYRYDRNRVDYGLDINRIVKHASSVGADEGAKSLAGVKGVKASASDDNAADFRSAGSVGAATSAVGANGAGSNIGAARPRVLFLHGTTWRTKHLPLPYWHQLASLATDAGYQVLLPWGNPAEQQRAQHIAADNSQATVLPRQSLSGLAAHIAGAAGVIAVDTGLGHLAAALGCPTVSLYGPTPPERSGTYGHRQLQLKSTLHCAPCTKKTCTYTGTPITNQHNGTPFQVLPPCFATHPPQSIWQQFQQLLSGATANAGANASQERNQA